MVRYVYVYIPSDKKQEREKEAAILNFISSLFKAVCGSAKKRKNVLHLSAAGMTDSRSEQAHPVSSNGERDAENPDKRYNGAFTY